MCMLEILPLCSSFDVGYMPNQTKPTKFTNIPTDHVLQTTPTYIPYVSSNIKRLGTAVAMPLPNRIIPNRRRRRPQIPLLVHASLRPWARRLPQRLHPRRARPMGTNFIPARRLARRRRVEIQFLIGILSIPSTAGPTAVVTAHVVGNRRRLSEAARGPVPILVDQNYHPHANGAGLAEQRRAVDPARAPFFVGFVEVGDCAGQPADFGGHAACAVGQCVADRGAHA
jgi:hypothetical protein